MALTSEEEQFLKGIYQNTDGTKPIEPDDPLYEPVYQAPGCEDPIALLQTGIKYSGIESLNLFSGFRGSGKTTELFRLRRQLRELGYVVLYANALDYLNPSLPIEIQDLLIVLAGAFGDALNALKIDINSENYWTRLWNWMTKTNVELSEISIKAEAGVDSLKAGADLKLELRTTPSFRQRLSSALSNRIGELREDVGSFFEDGVKAIRRQRGDEIQVVFLFDSLEQLRGSYTDEPTVLRSVQTVFANHLELLGLPYIHVVYTVPPWLKFVLPGVNMVVLPCVRTWNNDAIRSTFEPGILALRSLVEKRFSPEGVKRFFGSEPCSRVDRLIQLSGGHFRDLLLLLRDTILRTASLPVGEAAIERSIVNVRSHFLPISLNDAKWLRQIESERETSLTEGSPEEVARLTLLLDTHIVLYLKNGDEWYDIHPLVREEVARIVGAAEAAEARLN